MTERLLRAAAFAAALTLLAAACGDDDPLTETATPAADAEADAEMSDDDMSDDDSSDDDMAGMDDDADHADDHDADHDGDGDADHAADHDDDADHDADMDDAAMGHDHAGPVDVVGPVPTVDIEVFDDPAGGVDIHVITTGYTIAPQSASTEHVDGEGHFHLYVDGEKRLRFYNEWIHVEGLEDGAPAQLKVELSANDHRPYADNGTPIVAAVTHDVAEHVHDDHGHGEAEPQVATGAPVVDISVVDDPKSGWNLHVDLADLTLAPEHASGDHVDGEGHLHVMVNGQKIARLYGTDMHISTLPDGEVTITVAAFTNDHRPYLVDGQPVAGSVDVTV